MGEPFFFFTDSGMLLLMATGIRHRSPWRARIVLWSRGQKLASPCCCVMFNSIFQSLSPAGPVPPTLLYFNVQHSWSQVGGGKGHLFVFGKSSWWRGMTFSFGQVNGKKVRLMFDHWTPPLPHCIITLYENQGPYWIHMNISANSLDCLIVMPQKCFSYKCVYPDKIFNMPLH